VVVEESVEDALRRRIKVLEQHVAALEDQRTYWVEQRARLEGRVAALEKIVRQQLIGE
jgi:cell division protein FtsB